MPFKICLIPAATAAFLLVACGGGAGSSNVTAARPTSGYAIDGYLNGSQVLCDSNGNGMADAGEAIVTTNANGQFTFPNGCSSGITVSGGTSVDSGALFVGLLKAPAGSGVATPLTTLLVEGMTQVQIKTALNLSTNTDLQSIDPALKVNGAYVSLDLLKKTLAVQQLIQKTTEMFAGITGGAGNTVLQSIYTEVAAAFAETLKKGPLISGTSMDESVVILLVQAAKQRVQLASGVSLGVKNSLLMLDAQTLAVVSASSLKAQADALLVSTDSNLTAVTLAKQNDSNISSFIKANLAQLKLPLNADSVDLGKALLSAVNGITPAITPTDYLALSND